MANNTTNVLSPFWHNGSVSPGLNLYLNLSDNNVTHLTFDSGISNFTNFARAIHPLFNESMFSYSVNCAFPLSGQYGDLPRSLYYILLVFALVLRRHIWLSTAALGTAMTYAATAAVHAIAINTKFKFKEIDYSIYDPNRLPSDYGDLDILGTLPILMAACIMLTPILNWSITVRQNEARPVVVYWGLLMFAATIMVLVDIYGKNPYPLEYIGTANCFKDVAKGCTEEFIVANFNSTFSSSFYNNCNCVDFCGSIQTSVPFRNGQQMQFYGQPPKLGKLSNKNFFLNITIANILFMILVIIQGVFGLVESEWSQAEVRNWVFRKLTSSQLHDRFFKRLKQPSRTDTGERHMITKIYVAIASAMAAPFLAIHKYYHLWIDKSPGLTKCHNLIKRFFRGCLFYYAKWTAAGIYVFALVLALICPLLLVSAVVVNEVNIRLLPNSENLDAVGQWGAWVGAFFVIFAAVVIRYNSAFWSSVGTAYYTVVRFFRFIRGTGPLRYDRETSPANNSLWGETKKFLYECTKPFTHMWRSTVHAWDRTALELRDFRDWWRDPIQHSTWDWVGGESGWWEGKLNEQELFKSWDDKDQWKAFQGGQRDPKMTRKEFEDRKAERIAMYKARKTRKSKNKHTELPVEEKDSTSVDVHSIPTTHSDSERTSGSPQSPKVHELSEDTQADLEAHNTDAVPFRAQSNPARQTSKNSTSSAADRYKPRKDSPTRRDSELPALPQQVVDLDAPPMTGDSLSTEQGSFVPTALTSPPVAHRRQSEIVPPVSIYNTQIGRNSTAASASRRGSGPHRRPSDPRLADDYTTSRLESSSN